MSARKYLVLLIISVSGSCGDFFLTLGMKRVPPITLQNLGDVVLAMKEPMVILGIFLLIGFFAAYLSALSWADLSFVLPATAFGYIVVALLARFALGEQITVLRWLGILCITAGVGFVTQSPAKTTPENGTLVERAGGMHP